MQVKNKLFLFYLHIFMWNILLYLNKNLRWITKSKENSQTFNFGLSAEARKNQAGSL